MIRTLAVDPGLSGGWATFHGQSLQAAGDLPVIGEGSKRRIDAGTFVSIVVREAPDLAVIEDVSAMPGQGVSSMFRFGRAVGMIEGVLLARGVAIHRVAPQTWKKFHKLTGKVGGSGEPSRQRAMELWPILGGLTFARKKDHNRAEAALIGAWFMATIGRNEPGK